jgi:hypothetical protein
VSGERGFHNSLMRKERFLSSILYSSEYLHYIKDAICQVSIFDALLTSFAKVVLFPDIAMAKGIINTSLTIMCPSD